METEVRTGFCVHLEEGTFEALEDRTGRYDGATRNLKGGDSIGFREKKETSPHSGTCTRSSLSECSANICPGHHQSEAVVQVSLL
jgi:hypothetical protein